METISTGTLNNIPYPEYNIEIEVNTMIEQIAIILIFFGILLVSKYFFTNFPNFGLLMTQLYILSLDFIKNDVAIIRKIVPGSPGNIYPRIPIPKNKNPIDIKKYFFILFIIKFLILIVILYKSL